MLGVYIPKSVKMGCIQGHVTSLNFSKLVTISQKLCTAESSDVQ